MKHDSPRLQETADIVEASIELQRLIATNQNPERVKELSQKIAEMVFDADLTTLTGAMECLGKIVKD